MGATAATGLKLLQWIFRAIQLICSAIILGIYSYFLATLISHGSSNDLPNWVKAVEGIAAVGTVHAFLGVLLVGCLSGHPLPSLIAMVLDGALAGAYIYVAVANRAGAGACSGAGLQTVYGSGDERASPSLGDGATPVPSYGFACHLMTACFAAALVAIFFFALSPILEISINRHRYRAERGLKQSQATPEMVEGPNNNPGNYVGRGLPGPPVAQPRHAAGFRGMFFPSRRRTGTADDAYTAPRNPNALPSHPRPSDMTDVPIMGEVSSLHEDRIASDELAFNDGGDHRPPPPVRITTNTAPRPAAGVYNEGDVSPETYLPAPEVLEEQIARPPAKEEGGNTKKKAWRSAAVDRYTNA